MAYTRHLYPRLNFALTQCTGMIEDNQLLIYIMSFQAETKQFAFIRELVDTRHLHNLDRLTVKGLVRIAGTHKELFAGRDFRRAVLSGSETFGKVSEIYSLMVNSGDLHVKVFHDEMDAPLAWLGYDLEERRQLKRFISRHVPKPRP